MSIVLFARENPFVPVNINNNKNLIKKQYFQKTKIILPSDARVLKNIIFKYQTLTGQIKTTDFPINKEIDWHNPIIIFSNKKQIVSKNFKINFLNFSLNKNVLLIKTDDKIVRNFFLVSPFRYVIDFQADKNFLTFNKKIDTFIKKVVLGNHKNFYRVVLYLDGKYKINIKKDKKGYLVEFK
jgi:hypothetical protein